MEEEPEGWDCGLTGPPGLLCGLPMAFPLRHHGTSSPTGPLGSEIKSFIDTYDPDAEGERESGKLGGRGG